VQVSVGIGLTSDCNLNCSHCYRPQDAVYHLSLEDVQAICDRLDVASFNMGTGESWLHPQFAETVEYVAAKGIKMSMASNGYSLNRMPTALLCRFHDVEVSVDFPTAEDQDAFRGQGNWACVMRAIDRCHRHGVVVTILATLMSTNYNRMAGLVAVAREAGTNLRVNVYQPVHGDGYTPTYEQFWEAYRQLLGNGRLLSTSEPIVHAMLGLDGLAGSPCGRRSIRFTPRRAITPCVYWPEPDLGLADLHRLTAEEVFASAQFRRARQLPDACRDCVHVARCGGGCASRRALLGDLGRPDIYCPLVRGQMVQLSYTQAPQQDLPRGSNVCTTIIVP
jgi:radical SAM protein with 4Fe4S-binding SPASM domain